MLLPGGLVDCVVVSPGVTASFLVTTGLEVGSGNTPGGIALASPASIVAVVSPAGTAGIISSVVVVGMPASSSPTE